MAANDSRPIYLDLFRIHLPVTAWASILHRVSAVIIWVGLGFILWLAQAASTPAGFADLTSLLADSFVMKFLSWGFLTALGYYCTGSLKHIIQDMGYFEDFAGGKLISWAAIGSGITMSVLMGVAIWA